MSDRFGTPEWATESGIWIFASEVMDNAWALGSFWILLGVLLAVWVAAYTTYSGKTGRLVAGFGMSALVVMTWASVLYQLLDGLVIPYVVVFAIWALLTAKFGKIGFIIGACLFFGATMSFYLAAEWWIWAESW
jgi:mannose/fructose/N-acetylgalactosamine-specific phosphotransferase system component IID